MGRLLSRMTEEADTIFHICGLINLEGLRTVWSLMAATNGETSPSACVSKSEESLSSSWLYCTTSTGSAVISMFSMHHRFCFGAPTGGKRTLKIPTNLGYGERGALCR